MANPLTSSLARLFRDRAKPTSLRKLKREGYSTVPVLDISQLEELVGLALERVIMETSDDPVQGRKLAKNAQVEFLKLLGNPASLVRAGDQLTQEKAFLEENLQAVRASLTQAREDLQHQAEQQDSELLQELEDRLQASLTAIFGQTSGQHLENSAGETDLATLQNPVKETVMDLMKSLLARSRQDSEGSGAKVELLERRVRKLNASLDEARSMLDRLRNKRIAEEEGVASVYSEVQGLRGDEQHLEQRRKLLSEVFQLNLDIRKEIQNQETDSSGSPASG